MNSRGLPPILVLLLLLVALGGGAAAGVLGYIWVTGGSGEASLTADDALATRMAEESRISYAIGTAVADVAATVIPSSIAQAMAEAQAALATALPADTASNEPREFRIIAAESRASFALEEDLRGQRITVVGSTQDIAGTVTVDLAQPSAARIGTILINARSLQTDNSMRDRAIRSRILYSAQDENEFIVFEARELGNFSADSVAPGEELRFDISGDLTVSGTTRRVSFAAEVRLESETALRGNASVTLRHSDFGLVIPDVPSVANVSDEVRLRLEFVARAEG